MRLAPLLLYSTLVWVAAIVVAPALASAASPAAVVAGLVVYRAASVVCHQIPERSFQLSALPLAVCARCLGLYVGAASASVAALLVGSGVERPGPNVRFVSSPGSGPTGIALGPDKRGPWTVDAGPRTRLAIAALPTAATWVLESVGWWAGSNAVRFAAALPLGFAAARIVLDALRSEEPIQ